MQASIGADLELERRLDDFARARLTPSDAAKARLRARVMREARLSFADQAAQAAAAVHHEPARASGRRTVIRRGVGVLLAAALSLALVGGALAASTAGGPLYGARLWLETITLPADGSARAEAEIRRLDARLGELQAAVRSGDRAAVASALAAYGEIADQALAVAGTDTAAIDRILAALDRHVGVLEGVASRVPPQAAESINRNITRAIEHSDAAIERIESRPTGPRNGAAPAVKPEKSAKPASTPKPAAAPTAAAATAQPTPKPTPSPPAKPSPKPHKTPPGQGGPLTP